MKVKPTIKKVSNDRYLVRDGKYALSFSIDDKHQVTVYKDTGSGNFKEFKFVDSSPMVMLKVGRLLKYAAGHALQQKKLAETAKVD